jgi:putative CocE/NonD family hydrolase
MPAGRKSGRLLACLGAASAWLLAAPALQAQPAPAGAAVAPSFGHYRPAPRFTEQVTSSLYLPMRDGVRLAVTIARPARDGKPAEGRFPVIWHHTLSATQSPADGTGPFAGGFRAMPSLTRYGYVVVQIARRGNGQSFGERRGYHDRNEAQDAYEIVDWLARQDWSDGKVGIYGCTNTGDAAMHAVTMRPPALKAAFMGCFSWHKYDAFRRGGIFAQWGTGPARTIAEDMDQQPVDGDEAKVLLRQAAEEHQRSTPLLEMWKEMPFRDSFSRLVASRFWAEGSSASYADQVGRSGVALYIVGGWRDELRDQGLITWLNVPGSRIVIGPWQHCANDDFALLEEAHRFFDLHLKGIDTGLAGEAPIHYFTVNAPAGSEWRSAAGWPVGGTAMQPLLLGASGELTPAGKPRFGKPASFDVDYAAPCTGKGNGPFAQPCHPAKGGRSFAGPPLAAATEVTGSGVADLWIAGDAPDANLFAYLEDVAPDGTVEVVTEGRLKASLRKTAESPWRMPAGIPWHRANAEDALPLVPGEPARLSFELMPTSWIFRPGHRIQITLAGADYRERGREAAGLAKRLTVYTDRAHPSSVTLPVVAGQARSARLLLPGRGADGEGDGGGAIRRSIPASR